MNYHRLRVLSVAEETHDSKSIVFDVPDALAQTFHYKPGQFLTLRVPVNGKHLPRCYSLASSPHTGEHHRVTVKRVTNGRGSNWVCDVLGVGDEVEVMPPAGVFTPRSFDGDFLLFAGGSGITPVFSILRSALTSGTGRIVLVYANRDERSVIFRDELKALAATYPGRLQVVHWLDSVQGVPQVAHLAELARHSMHAQCFICGPGPFMDSAAAALRELNFPSKQVHIERFVSLPEEDEAGAAAAVVAAQDAEPVKLTVYLDGITQTIDSHKSETLLDAMLRAGLKAPFSCKAGACASCMCTVTQGKVHLKHNDVLDANDLADGWTLACQAVAESGEVQVHFPD